MQLTTKQGKTDKMPSRFSKDNNGTHPDFAKWTAAIMRIVPEVMESLCVSILIPISLSALLAVLAYRVMRGTIVGDGLLKVMDALVGFLLSPWTTPKDALFSPAAAATFLGLVTFAFVFRRLSVRAKRLFLWTCAIVLALWTITFTTPTSHAGIQELKTLVDSLEPGDTYGNFCSVVPRKMYWKFKKPQPVPDDLRNAMSTHYGQFFLSDQFGPPSFVVLLAGEDFSRSGFLGNLFGLRLCEIVTVFFSKDMAYCGCCPSRLSIPPWKELDVNPFDGWVPHWFNPDVGKE